MFDQNTVIEKLEKQTVVPLKQFLGSVKAQCRIQTSVLK
jgi:hypothetical protein